MHGYGHDRMLLHLRESAARYEPDVVLLGYLSPDDVRNLLSFRDFAKPYFELRDGRLELRGVPVPSPDDVLAAEPYRSKLLDLVETTVRRQRAKHGDLRGEMRRLTDALIVAFASSARELGATPLVVYFPMINELDDSPREPVGREKEVAELCAAHGIPFLSLRERFHRTLLGHRRTARHHWDATEHAVAAEEMAAYLRRARLLDASDAARPGDASQRS